MRDGAFAGTVGVVIGAAGGIGSATSQLFGAEGAHVVLADVDDVAGHALAEAMRADGMSAEHHHCDATREEDVAALFGAIEQRHGNLHFAVNLVGGSSEHDQREVELHEQAPNAWDRTIALSLGSAFLCLRYEISAMLRSSGGAIVNVSSMAALHVTMSATPAYSAAKAGLLQLTRYAAVGYASRGIRVNAVAPALTASPGAIAALGLDGIEREVAAVQCIPRAAVPADQAAAIVWLCSDAAAMVTGHTLPVDGGWNAR